MANSERSVLGRPVSTDVAALLTDIEQQYGCEVVFKSSSDTTPYLGGTCTVAPDGMPIIEINERHELWEEAVVHELHHLLLRKEQYPFFHLENRVGSMLRLNNLYRMMFEVYEPILHHVFNPSIRRMGRNPAALFDAMFRKNLEPGELEQNKVDLAWPLVYFRVLLECNEPEVREALRVRCEGLGWKAAMERAKSMVAVVEALKEPTPGKAVDALIQCANFAFEDVYHFAFVGLDKVQKGNQTEQKVTISVALPG